MKRIGVLKWYHFILKYHLPVIWMFQHANVRRIRRNGKANVVFMATNIALWRYQHLYDSLSEDCRFCLDIIIYPFSTYTESENRRNMCEMKRFFNTHNMPSHMLDEDAGRCREIAAKADVVFYCQPYSLLSDIFGRFAKYSKLICYFPYSLQALKLDWDYNLPFHNLAWRLYYPSEHHRQIGSSMADNNGYNIRIVGEPHYDDFTAPVRDNVWKNCDDRKRIIWAPHFRIVENDMFNRASFLWTYDVMQEMAVKYQDRIQIAFKPHPRLYSTLCSLSDWGEQRTADYYRFWETQPNTQLETGDFIDLFKTSHALIHDCGSFTSEYMFVKKPCMFLTRDEFGVRSILDEFGNACLDLHEFGQSKEDITAFIEGVINGKDDLRIEERTRLMMHYLIPPNNKSTAQNTCQDLVSSLFD